MTIEIKVFRASARNRVMHKAGGSRKWQRRLRGKQGNWHDETLIVVASDEMEARELVQEGIASRQVLGIPKHKLGNFEREIKIKIEVIA
jgi:hypothetical protein